MSLTDATFTVNTSELQATITAESDYYTMKAIEKNLLILEEMWNRTLTVDLIAEKLVCRQNHDLSRAVAKYMDERHWDVIGICGKAEGAKAHAYVHREDLNTADTCEDARSEFSVDRLVSGHTPIRQCFLRIIEQDWLFVLGPKGVDGIVTCADLQKQPACMMLFATVLVLYQMPDVLLGEKFGYASIKGTLILITMVSIMGYVIHLTARSWLSSRHLAHDAEERRQLTYVYLALMEKEAITSEELNTIILQALFSRAESGLLKGDHGPEMPTSIPTIAKMLGGKGGN